MLSKYQCRADTLKSQLNIFKFTDALLEKRDFDMAYIFIIFC